MVRVWVGTMSKVNKINAGVAKDTGNEFFLAKQYNQAAEWYTKGNRSESHMWRVLR